MNTITENTTTNTTETSVESVPTQIMTSDLRKPTRKEFFRDVVLDAAGTIIEESAWKPLVGDLQPGRAMAGKLRRSGMQLVHLFDRGAYETAKKDYSSALKAARVNEREMMILNAFSRAETPVEPHIERALKDLLPMFSNVPTNKATVALKNVVKTVVNCVGIKKEDESQSAAQTETTETATA